MVSCRPVQLLHVNTYSINCIKTSFEQIALNVTLFLSFLPPLPILPQFLHFPLSFPSTITFWPFLSRFPLPVFPPWSPVCSVYLVIMVHTCAISLPEKSAPCDIFSLAALMVAHSTQGSTVIVGIRMLMSGSLMVLRSLSVRPNGPMAVSASITSPVSAFRFCSSSPLCSTKL